MTDIIGTHARLSAIHQKARTLRAANPERLRDPETADIEIAEARDLLERVANGDHTEDAAREMSGAFRRLHRIIEQAKYARKSA